MAVSTEVWCINFKISKFLSFYALVLVVQLLNWSWVWYFTNRSWSSVFICQWLHLCVCVCEVFYVYYITCISWSKILLHDFAADAEFRNTGLERSEKLAKDLEWFKEQGYTIPEPSSPGISYAQYLEELSEKDPQAFICHFYNIYFAHSAGGRMIGKKVLEL